MKDDLTARTANLSISDAGHGRNDDTHFPPMKSVWPTSTHSQATTSPAASYATFDVADRTFDKDPRVLKAEHARVSPAIYFRESPLREVPPVTQANGTSNGVATGAGAGAGTLAAEHGHVHPSPSPAQRSLDGQIGDTRQTDLGPVQSNDVVNARSPIESSGAQPNVPHSFAGVPMPQQSTKASPQSDDHSTPLASQSAMPQSTVSEAHPQSIPNGFSQNGAPSDRGLAQQNLANDHDMAKAAGVGAGTGLAAAGAARMLNSHSEPQQHGDYFGNARSPEPSAQMPPPRSPVSHRRALSPTQQAFPQTQQATQPNGDAIAAPAPVPASGGTFRRLSGQHVEGVGSGRHERSVSETTRANTAANAQTLERPQMVDAPSRSYIKATPPPETRYERPLDGVQRRLSNQSAQRVSRSSSTKFVEQPPSSPGGHAASPVNMGGAAAAGAAGGMAGGALANHVREPRSDPYARPMSAHEFGHRSSTQQESDGPFGRQRPTSAMAGDGVLRRDASMRRDGSHGSIGSRQALSPSASMRGHGRLPPIADEAGYAGVGAGSGLAVGEVATLGRQHEMQGHGLGRALRDEGPVPYDRPYSQFGHRPEPGIGDWQARREEGRLARSGTALSRTTVGRSRSRRSGAFGRGAGLTVGTQPEDVLARDDIHERTEVAERVLSPATLRKIQGMEKREGRAFAKMLKAEGKEQARAVEAALVDLKRMAKMQKSAIDHERKAQRILAKWTGREHRARMRFLREKERYEKVEGELRNAENDYEERRDHAAGLTAQIAEKTQELDDLRAQKAADDREREVKLLAIKNPGHV
ncbi:unnamed protein product [Cutaneotrichosporon oleaginosum]